MSEVLQRWRLVFARDEEAQFLSHLDAVRLWERAFRRGGIPVARSEGFTPRSKLIFAAPLQLGMLAEHELADLFLAERLRAANLRHRLAAGMPPGYRIVDLHDVWIGAPALAPQLTAADYRMTLLNVEGSALEGAAARLLTAESLPRERRREARTTPYDLRPLLVELRVRAVDPTAALPDVAAPATGLWMRLRHSQSLGSGRADEVVAALAEELGMVAMPAPGAIDDGEGGDTVSATAATAGPSSSRRQIEVIRPVRERLWLLDEALA